MKISHIVSLSRALGMPVSDARLPSGVVAGPFAWSVDLGVAIGANTMLQSLLLASSCIDPQLRGLGYAVDAPEIGLMLYGAQLLVGGGGAGSLSPTVLAQLDGALHLRANIADDIQHRPLWGGVAVAARYYTQAAAADAAANGPGEPRLWSTPLMIPSLRSASEFGVWSSSAVALPGDLSTSRLALWGVAYQSGQVEGLPGGCGGTMTGRAAAEIGGAKLLVNSNL